MSTAVEAPPAVGPPSPRRRRRLRWAAPAFAVVGAATVLVPQATVTIAVPTRPLEATVTLRGERTPLTATVSQQRTTPVSGEDPSAHATGVVRFSYDHRPTARGFCTDAPGCPPSEVRIPQGAIVGTCSGGPLTFDCTKAATRFTTTAPARVRIGSFSELVPVRAVTPGAEGQAPVASIRVIEGVPVHDNAELTVDNPDSTTMARGGFVGQADVDRAVSSVETRLRGDVLRKLRETAADRGLALADDVDVRVTVESSPPVGRSASEATITATATATATGYDEGDFRAAARAALDGARPPGVFVVSDSVRWRAPQISGDTLVSTATALASSVDVGDVASRVRARTPGAADRALEDDYGRGTVTITRKPVRLPFLPLLRSRIDVRVAT